MPLVKFWWKDPLTLQQVGRSWSAAFRKDFNPELWNWWLKQNPLDARVIAAYIEEEGEVACFYTVSPRTLISPSGRKLKAGLMNAGFTHPAYQGRGYYLEVNRALHVELQSMGFDCIFGFANHNSHYSYRKYLDWNDVGLLTNFRLTGATAKGIIQPASDMDIKVSELDASGLDGLDSCQVTWSGFHVERGREFLQWRLVDNPAKRYRLLRGSWKAEPAFYAIFKSYADTEADLMELFFVPDSRLARETALRGLAGHFLASGFKAVNLWSNLHTEEHLILEKIGFREETVTTHFGVIDFTGQDSLSEIRNWHYRFLDSDLY